MADIVESTPAELNMEGEKIKEKTCEDVEKTTEKGDCHDNGSPVKSTVDTTEDVQSTGTKRKSDEAENEEEEAKKVKKDDEEEVNGSDKSAADDTTEKTKEALDSKEEEVVKKVVDDEEETPATEVASS